MVILALYACNQAPVVTITAPESGSEVVEGAPVTFVATVSDETAAEDLDLVWSADPGGILDGETTIHGDEITLVYTRSLLPGAVSITLGAGDASGQDGADTIGLVVVENSPPALSFVTPAPGAELVQYVDVPVEIAVTDADESDLGSLAVVWEGVDEGDANLDANGHAYASVRFLTTGAATIGAAVTDSAGTLVSATVAVSVLDRDDDDDGHADATAGGDDCDDADPTIHPGADEVCDGIDQDCDAAIDDDPVDGETWYPDNDVDRYGAEGAGLRYCTQPFEYVGQGGDCDDDDSNVHPEAAETCDGRDEDCDGIADDDVPGSPSWYPDADADGYGDDASEMVRCEQPAGSIAVGGDCDDADASVNPDGSEVCDAGDADEDCDGEADDADASVAAAGKSTFYADLDGDGYGSGGGASRCDAPGGYAAVGGDCDDSEPSAHPGATEVCEDGADNDCDGSPDPNCTLTGVTSLAGADAAWTGVSASDTAGEVDWAGDVNADGYDDVLVGAWGRDYNGTGSGATYIIYGPFSGTTALNLSDTVQHGAAVDDASGWAIDGLGDADGDGKDDILVGAYGSDSGGVDAGSAYLVKGPMTASKYLSKATATFVGESAGDYAGLAVAGAGDTDDDGLPDALVGAYGHDGGGNGAGAVYLLAGGLSGTIDLSAADARLLGENDDDRAGYAVASAGDTDGDGHDDVLIGAVLADSGVGAAYLVRGPRTGDLDLASADWKATGGTVDDWTGCAVSTAGDTDGDGNADILVGAYQDDAAGTEAGAAYLFVAPTSGTFAVSAATAILRGASAGDRLGWSLEGGGDADGDGAADLLLGAYYEGTVGTGAGAAYLVYGPLVGTLSMSSADAAFAGESARDNAGKSVAFGGDADADGYADLLVGAPGSSAAASGAGAAYLVLGGGG